MTTSPAAGISPWDGPPPWPIPPAWPDRPTADQPAADQSTTGAPAADPAPVSTFDTFDTGGSGAPGGETAPAQEPFPGLPAPEAAPAPAPVTSPEASQTAESADGEVGVIDLRTVPASSLTLEDAHELSQMVEGAGGPGVVIILAADAVTEIVWALELISTVDRPIVVVGAEQPGRDAADPPDLAAAVRLAAGGSPELGCVVVADSLIHAARYVRRRHGRFTSAPLGPVGRVGGEALQLLGRPPATRVRGPFRRPLPRVVHHVAQLGDDGTAVRELTRASAGLVVEVLGARTLPNDLAAALTEQAERIPVAVAGEAGADQIAGAAVSTLDAEKARILLAFLLAAGHDRAAALAAFTGLDRAAALPGFTGPTAGDGLTRR